MPAPEGNEFWKLRATHGRKRLFASPELLWQAACDYFEWCQKNPWFKNELVKSGELAGKVYKVPTERPFSMSGICLYFDCNPKFFTQFKESLKPETIKKDKDFSTIISHIEQSIRTQQFEGASVGAFNANIISRMLGLAENTKNETTVKMGADLDDENYL